MNTSDTPLNILISHFDASGYRSSYLNTPTIKFVGAVPHTVEIENWKAEGQGLIPKFWPASRIAELGDK